MNIKNLFEKNDLSVYDAATLLEGFANGLKQLDGAIMFHREDIGEQARDLVEQAREAGRRYLDAYNELDRADADAVEMADRLYDRHKEERERLIRRIERLPKLPDLVVPYGYKELIEIAERFARLTDEQWQRVVDLARSFQRKDQ